MSFHHPRSVKFTGASAGACLVGVQPFNEGLVIRVAREQRVDGTGGRVFGAFELLDAGWGEYAAPLRRLVGQRFESVERFLDQLRQVQGAELATHPLNRGELVSVECLLRVLPQA